MALYISGDVFSPRTSVYCKHPFCNDKSIIFVTCVPTLPLNFRSWEGKPWIVLKQWTSKVSTKPAMKGWLFIDLATSMELSKTSKKGIWYNCDFCRDRFFSCGNYSGLVIDDRKLKERFAYPTNILLDWIVVSSSKLGALFNHVLDDWDLVFLIFVSYVRRKNNIPQLWIVNLKTATLYINNIFLNNRSIFL